MPKQAFRTSSPTSSRERKSSSRKDRNSSKDRPRFSSLISFKSKDGKRKRSLNQQIRSASRKLAELTRHLQARRELEQEIYKTKSRLARLKGFNHMQGVRTRETRPNTDNGHQQQPVLHSPGRIPPPGVPRRDKSQMADDLRLRLDARDRGQKAIQARQEKGAVPQHQGRPYVPSIVAYLACLGVKDVDPHCIMGPWGQMGSRRSWQEL